MLDVVASEELSGCPLTKLERAKVEARLVLPDHNTFAMPAVTTEPVSAPTPAATGSTATAPVPRDARIIALLLASMGVDDCEPNALRMLLDFAHRYTHDVLQDALVYSDHAASRTGMASNISLDDVQLAIQARVNHEFTGPPPKEMLLSLASTVNSVPLPPISERYGVRLPPPQHCLTNIDYSVVPNAPPVRTDAFAPQLDENGAAAAQEQQRGMVGEEDADDVRDADGDRAMTGVQEQRGTKRGLEEDDDYD